MTRNEKNELAHAIGAAIGRALDDAGVFVPLQVPLPGTDVVFLRHARTAGIKHYDDRGLLIRARNTVHQARRDDIGFDPRDGSSGKPERQHVPKQPFRPRSKQARKAMRGKLGTHKAAALPFYPAARPKRSSP